MKKVIQGKRNPKIKFPHLKKCVLFSIICLFGLGIGSCRHNGNGPVITITSKKIYILAFEEKGTHRIRMRWSENGVSWRDCDNFPGVATGRGVGMIFDDVGWRNLVFWADALSRLQMAWGFWIDDWETRHAGPLLNQVVLSTPSPAYAGDDIYLIAFRTYGDIVSMRALNIKEKKWLDTNFAPTFTMPSNVCVGSPVIDVLNGKVVMAWLFPNVSVGVVIASGDLQVVTKGGVKVPEINWTNVASQQFAESGFGRPRSDLDLTNDGSTFYLGFARRTIGGPLIAEWLFIYPSIDGIAWGAPIKKGGISPYSEIDIAARTGGNLLAACIGSGSEKRELHLYNNGSWTQIMKVTSSAPDNVFGWIPEYTNFTLIANRP